MDHLFQGLLLDRSRWIEGEGHFKGKYPHIHEGIFSFRIIPESVGLFTGQPDSKGIKIFGGHILKIQLPCGGFWGNVSQEKIGVVLYSEDRCGFIVQWAYSKNQHHVNLDCDIACKSIIIGHIIDNPELLKR